MNCDVHGALRAAISGRFHPTLARVQASSHHRWSSVTFVGARHRFAVCVAGEGRRTVRR
jgi:hypothetical protein